MPGRFRLGHASPLPLVPHKGGPIRPLGVGQAAWPFAKLTRYPAATTVGTRTAASTVKQREDSTRTSIAGLAGACVCRHCVHGRRAQQVGTIKIGPIMPYFGQFADTATQMDNAIKLYVEQNGDTVAGKKIEIIRKDSGGIAPDVAKRLAQELVTRDKVFDILGGLILTPNARRLATFQPKPRSSRVIMNAATSIITTKSPYMARTSVTTPMLNQTLGTWAVKKGGAKKIYSMVSDFGPGHDAEAAFQLGVKEASGEIVGSVRFPVDNPDFSAFVQRAKDLNPDAIYIWIPGGTQPAAGRQGRSPSAASIRRRRGSWARTCWPTKAHSKAWATSRSAS